MTRRPSRDELTFLALWRKLARGEEIPPLTFANASQATSVKVKAYLVLKPYRDGIKLDPELELAAADYSIKQKGNVLTFSKKGYVGLADPIIQQLGLTEADLKTPDELAVEQAMAGLAASQPTTNERDYADLVAKYMGEDSNA
jgi:hypothetical protein